MEENQWIVFNGKPYRVDAELGSGFFVISNARNTQTLRVKDVRGSLELVGAITPRGQTKRPQRKLTQKQVMENSPYLSMFDPQS